MPQKGRPGLAPGVARAYDGAMRGLFVLALAVCCGCDAAKADYEKCVADTERGDLSAAQAACSAAMGKDPNSASGKSAREQLERVAQQQAGAKKKADEDAAAKKKAEEDAKRAEEEAKNGIEVDCNTLLKAFMSDRNAASTRYLHKRVRTSGKITDTKWVADGNFEFCSIGSDAERQASGILCKLDPATPQDVKAALQVGGTVKVLGAVDKFFQESLDLGAMSQLTITPCEIVK